MRLLLGFLILTPLAVALFLLVSLVSMAYNAPNRNVIGGVVVLLAICAALIWAATRILVRNGSLLTFPGSDTADLALRRTLTRLVVTVTYLVLIGYAVVLAKVETARGWLGVVFIVLAGWHMLTAIGRFRRAGPAPRAMESGVRQEMAEPRSILRASTRRAQFLFIAVGTALVAIAIIYYAHLGGRNYLQLIDLVGFVVLAGAFVAAAILDGIANRRALDDHRL